MKIPNITKVSKAQILLILLTLTGILFMTMGDGLHTDSFDKSATSSQNTGLESRIARVIMDTYGLSNVSVILTYDTNGEKITSSDNAVGKSDGVTFGSGVREPFVISEKLPYVRGALISAPHISDSICNDIVNGVATLLGINPTKIKVIYQKNN